MRSSKEGDSLFTNALEEHFDEFAPLAARMRPQTLDDFVGQRHMVGPGSPLRSLIEADKMTSVILWGPPGSGKTTLAHIVAKATKSRYAELSAVNATVAEVRKNIADAKDALAATGRRTLLFIDEIHRFNKGQQDALLPAVENRWVVLIGATTENPFFEVNSPLLSRSMLFRLEKLTPEDIRSIVMRTIEDEERGLGKSGIKLEEDAVGHIVQTSGGDARSALNALEVCVAAATASGSSVVTLATAEETLQRRRVVYDKKGDAHYDVISAFIKSMRGSDPDAALYWLAVMLEAGEDPRFIARRIVIFASEDVGNADPMALVVSVAAFHALEFVGLPEAHLNLAQAVTYVASAPKSNASTLAIGRAADDVKAAAALEVPVHLRGSHPHQPAKMGRGKPYLYPHDFPDAWVDQSYRPEDADHRIYYAPTDHGAEMAIKQRLDDLRSRRSPTKK
ncbi:MAG TPA: replication-associated recombination protein A [Actinomycetota bacterium]|nr:replication-associated recombination protein A [Actinomycetota bacterium]